MSTTPQMSQLGQQQGQQGQHNQGQQGPSAAPPQPYVQQQPFGQQMQQPFGQQGGNGQQQQQIPQQVPQQIPPHLQQQLQHLGQQQPFQHLLQQLGGQQQAQALVSGVAEHFWDVVTPLPGQPSILYLYINQAWRPLVNPNQVTHDEVQEAFAFGQQVIGFYEQSSNAVTAVIVNK